MTRLILAVSAFLAFMPITAPAFAHARLISSSPAAGATVAKPSTLKLNFSEKLIEKLSGVDIVMTGMPGAAKSSPMKVTGFKSGLTTDSKTLVITLPRPLPAGSYELSWHVVTVDTHRIVNKFRFAVK